MIVDVKKELEAIRVMADVSGVFYKDLRKIGVPRKEAARLTEGFLRELLQLIQFKEDN